MATNTKIKPYHCSSYVSLFLKESLKSNTLKIKPFYDSFILSCLYQPEDINIKIVPNEPSAIKILSLNRRSLQKSFNDLQIFLHDSKVTYDIIALTETWLNEHNDVFLNINNYSLYNSNRLKKRGGVAIFVEKNKFSIERPDLSISNTTCEIIAIEVIFKVSKNRGKRAKLTNGAS